ncbi:uncharacterized protein [Haliotis asinina]|uniref:uncharacterized protein isoform X3 n=1 Tax=Haliotis asinina TaxID=109174 RepID=UPI00353203EF
MAQRDIVNDAEDMYYPIGNTKSVDVTHGCQVAEECNILLLGCGDIRHVLHTMHVLHEDGTTKAKNQTISFHINDIEDGILARDLILLFLARTINPSNTDELNTLWAVWYDVLLSNAHVKKLKEVMEELLNLESGTNGIYFGNGKTELKIKQALQCWLEFELSGRQTVDKRTDYLTAMYGEHFPKRSVQRVSSRILAQSNRLDNTERLKDRYQQEVLEYTTSGVSRANSTAMTSERILDLFHGNMTFFRPGSDNWNVQDNCCSFMCYDVELQLDRYNGGDITMCSLFLEILKKWVISYQAAIKTGCKIRFSLWLGDAIEVCETDLPNNLLFDFIDTSNIADRVGLIPLLIRCQERLQKPHGVLRTETFHWFRGGSSSLESFLRQCLDVHQLMYPTLFGLHLAEELTLGHENVLEDGIFVGVRKFELRWKAAREQEMLTLSADGRDALSKCLALLKSRMDVVYACDTRSDNIAKIDSKSKKKLMHRLSKLTTDEAPADSDISTRNTLVPTVVSIRVPSQADPSNRVNNRFYLEGLKIYENKPTLFLTFIDMDKMTQLQEEIPPYLPLLLESVELDPHSAKYLAPGFSMLMQILELNSYRRAQDYRQEPDKRWLMRTYLRARYPYTDYQTYKMTLSGMPEDYIKLISLLRSQLPTRSEDVAPRPSTHSCDNCGRTSTECKKCTGCHLVYYCDRACQKKAWPEHKHACRRT